MADVNPRVNVSFSPIKRVKSFAHAVRGLNIFIRSTQNAWIEVFFLIAVLFFGFYFNISSTEWMLVVFASGLVLTAEALNTAIEIHMDLTSPDHHPYARDTKDVAAGAVLIAALTAAIIGIVIFSPHIFALLG